MAFLMNHLQTEKSPYLQQHIDNPVDWYPWSAQAFELARDGNKLIFLSIGYSTCHWCHVMAHESFEDDEVAALLNLDYVSIKIDREERPDIDQVYMEVCQRLTKSGGWPLTIIMTLDGQPFYAATYLPKHGRHGRPGMMDLLPWITSKWQEEPEFLCNAALEIVTEMQKSQSHHAHIPVSLKWHQEAEKALNGSFDRVYGGFGQAPKFPRPHDLTFLLQQHQFSGDEHCLKIVQQTLQSMRNGGIYDHLGFGFHRYATDKQWLVPHFEKMLYDQAGLVSAYLEAWCVTGLDIYARTVHETLSYLLRDMISPESGFFSAEDADSEGVEGKFYLWSKSEIDDLLGDQAEEFCKVYHIQESGNYHDEMTGQVNGNNILHVTPTSLADPGVKTQDEQFAEARLILFQTREKRIRPHLDDKVITAWNGMAISALANAGRLLGNQAYIDNASQTADFVLTKLRGEGGRLYRRCRHGEAAVSAFSEDYAFLARGLLELYNANFDPDDLFLAIEIAKLLRDLFQEPDSGRLYDTAHDSEKLLVRPSSSFDGAMPSASSIALEVFARISLLTGDSTWQQAADQLLLSLSFEVSRYPAGYTQLLQSANWLLRPTREIVIVGFPGEPLTESMLNMIRANSLKQTVVLYKPVREAEKITNLSPFLEHMTPANDSATAYVCQNFTCNEPLTSADELREILSSLPE